jgi:hypothetical protein
MHAKLNDHIDKTFRQQGFPELSHKDLWWLVCAQFYNLRQEFCAKESSSQEYLSHEWLSRGQKALEVALQQRPDLSHGYYQAQLQISTKLNLYPANQAKALAKDAFEYAKKGVLLAQSKQEYFYVNVLHHAVVYWKMTKYCQHRALHFA